ncbi:MAG: histidine kinase dimerization/phosphoacceptor domain -containing protein [Chitinophagales bacterium]
MTGYAQGTIPFEPVGNYTWVKNRVISKPEKLPSTVYQRKATVRKESRVKKQLYQRKAKLFIEQVPGTFNMPKMLDVKFTGQKLKPTKKIPASPFYYKDNALFDMVYSDKAHGFYTDGVEAIAEDNEKNMWMAAADGLIRFDGYNYYIYTGKSGVVSSLHHVLYEPSTGIWISSSNGFQLIRNDSVFDAVIKGVDVHELDVCKVNVDGRKNIWINTFNNGALQLDRSLRTAQHFDTACGLLGNTVRCAVLDKNGQYWFAGSGLTTVKGKAISHWQSSKKYFNDDEFLVLVEDADSMWLGTFDNGVYRVSPTDTTQISIYPHFGGRVFDMIKSDGVLWFTLYGGGLVYKIGDDYCVFNETNGLSSNLAYALVKDSYGNIWVSTPDAGMTRVQRAGLVSDFYAPEFLRNAEVIKKDNIGNRWYFLNGGGLWKETSEGYEFITNEAEKPVPSLRHFMDGVVNADGTAWLASYSYGIAYYDKKHITFYYYSDDPVMRVVLSAAADRLNRPWFGTLDFGLIYVQDNVLYHLTTADGLASNHIITVATGKDGSILCLSQEGMQKISNDTLYDLYVDNKPLAYMPQSFHTTSSGDYMLTSDKGLLLMTDSGIYRLASNDVVDPLAVQCILEDSKGDMWFKCENGIVKAQLQGLSLTNVYPLKSHNKKMLTRMDAAGYIDEDNLPHWSSGIGMLTFKPAFESADIAKPSFKIIEASLDGVPVNYNHIPAIFAENKLNVAFSVVCWGSEDAIKLRYLLINTTNKDTVVNQLTGNGIIEVFHLPEGEYQLVLAADLYQGVYYSQPMIVVVKPHWYSSAWFYFLCIGLVVLLLDRLYRFRTKSLQKAKQLLEDTVAIRTADLQHSLAEREVLLKEIHHRVKNNLQVISGLLELQTEEITDEKAKAVFREGQSRVSSVALIHHNLYSRENLSGIFFKSFANDLALQIAEVYGDKHRVLNVTLSGEDANLDIDTAVPLGLVMNELLTNAYKYAIPKEGPTEVTLTLDEIKKGHYQLTYRDNGPGIKGEINFESAKTLGLRLVKGLMQQIGGSVAYKYNSGAMFTLYFKDTATRNKE